MAIQWDDYIDPLTNYVRVALGINEDSKLSTRSIGDRNRLAAASELLSNLEWDASSKLYRSELGFIARLRSNERVFLILSSNIESLLAPEFAKSIADETDMDVIEYDDAFFLFCAKYVHLQMRVGFDVTELQSTLEFDEVKNRNLIGYSETRNAIAPICVWEVKNSLLAENSLLRYILKSERDESVSLECNGIGNVNFDIARTHRSFDLAEAARTLAKPILQHIDQIDTPVRLNIEEPEKFLPIFEGLHLARQEIVFRTGGGVFFRYEMNSVEYIGVSVANKVSETALIDYLSTLSIIYVDLQEHWRLALAYHLSGYLGFRTPFLESSDRLTDLPGINSELIEIDLSLINEIFDDILVFDISGSGTQNIWEIILKLASNFPKLCSPFVSNDLRALALTLSNTAGVAAENVYLSLTASHWKHSFLEAFRLVESLYYFGWMNKLKISLKSSLSEYELAQHCKGDLAWKSKELPSIQHLFALVPAHILSGVELESITSIRNKVSDAPDHVAKMRAFAAAVYSVRNTGVHQGEHESDVRILVTSDCWPKLTDYILKVVLFFYSDENYRIGMPQ